MARHIREVVKSALQDKGMTQAELARMIGKDQSLISRFIAGQPVSDATARAIADVLGIDFEELRIQLQRDRLERKRKSFMTEFKEVLDQEEIEKLTPPERTAYVGHVGLEEVPVAAVPLVDHIPSVEDSQWREKAGLYAVPSDVQLNTERSFALKVSIEDMTDDKVDIGDIIVLDTSAEPKDGDRVVVMLGGRPVLKKIYRRGETVVLKAPETSEEPIIFLSERDDFKIIGRVVLCVKHFAR